MKTRSRRPDGAWFDWFFSLVREPEFLAREPDLANLIFHYLMTTTDLHLGELQTKINTSSIPAETKQTVMTIAEQLRNEGIERGVEQGLRQGLRKGLLDQLQLLKQVLGHAGRPARDADPEPSDAEIEAKIAELRKELESRLQ